MIETCDGCEYSVLTECKRFPPTKDGYPLASKGCGEFKAVPVVVKKEAYKPVEEKKEIRGGYYQYPAVNLKDLEPTPWQMEPKEDPEEKASNPFNPPVDANNDLRKRGWPKGKPRK